jgi:glycosyltransferase involved in cell wall biosynthesis
VGVAGRATYDQGMSNAIPGRFSVVIPTLQKSSRLDEVVSISASHPLVLEVLVINNAPQPLAWGSPKVRVLQQEQNIFVNPAWNLGAREARGEYLAIVNDDIVFDPEALTHTAQILRRGWFGIVGPDRSTFTEQTSACPKHRLARGSGTIFGFGTFMCMRRADYVQIPEEMRIWGGDDWLILNQRRPPAALLGVRFRTEMGTSSGSPAIRALRASEQETADRVLAPLHGTRWWHRLVRWADAARGIRYQLGGAVIGRRGRER